MESINIFVSFARLDRQTARAFVIACRHAGLSMSWDEDIDHAREWVDALEEALNNCQAFVVLIGRDGVSGWVRAEVRIALARHFSRDAPRDQPRLPIIPVLVGDTPERLIPPFLSQFQYRRIDGPADTAAMAALVSGVRDRLFDDYSDTVELDDEVRNNPFPGLAPFNERYRSLFFGRHNDLLDALDGFRLARQNGRVVRWLRIEGNSGLGKSSLLLAGIIPALRAGWVDLGSPTVKIELLGTMRPGNKPLDELAALLSNFSQTPSEKLRRRLQDSNFQLSVFLRERRASEPRQSVLIIDQFEEFFTTSAEPQRCDQLLAEALSDADAPLYLITTMRADFAGEFDRLPRLSQCRRLSTRFDLLPMSEAGLADVIYRGAQLAGFSYADAELPNRLLTDARTEPGALPLISNVLRLMCATAINRELRYADYDRQLGGLGGALGQSADRLMTETGSDKDHAWRLLLALVEYGIGTPHARRTISWAQALAVCGSERGEEVLNHKTLFERIETLCSWLQYDVLQLPACCGPGRSRGAIPSPWCGRVSIAFLYQKWE